MIRKSNISKGKLSSFNRIQKNLEAVKNKLRAENIKAKDTKKSEQVTPQEKLAYDDTTKPKKKASIKEIKAQEERLYAERIEKAGVDYSQIKKPKNEKLNKARKVKNDEFYTDYSEIEKELAHYIEHFKDKIVLCNCDDPYYSEFWKYFKVRFKTLGLKKLIGTHYDNENLPSYAIEFSRDERYSLSYEDSQKLKNRYNTTDSELDSISDCKINWLNGDGDFRSEECLKYLKECGIVVTNPPFSLFREFISLLESFDKKFIILGNNNVITYSSFFPLILSNRVWAGFGFNKVMKFIMPDSYELKGNEYIDKDDGRKRGFVPSMSWFTNLPIKKRKEDLILYKTYNKTDYPKYDNYDAINVDKVKDIPIDYDGVMGVPVTFIDKYNPDQFEILGCDERQSRGFSNGILKSEYEYGIKQPLVGGNKKYKRLFIRRKSI